MSEDIPPIDPDIRRSQSAFREEVEFELLEAEGRLRRLAHREINQRYIVKWVAVSTGCLVIIGMATILSHLFHQVFWGPFIFASPAFSVAMIVAPITSITAITVALFIGAFRRFDDQDIEKMGSSAASAANFLRGN